MAQHFLLSAAARTLSLRTIYEEGEDAAYQRFCALRWPETGGAPILPALRRARRLFSHDASDVQVPSVP